MPKIDKLLRLVEMSKSKAETKLEYIALKALKPFKVKYNLVSDEYDTFMHVPEFCEIRVNENDEFEFISNLGEDYTTSNEEEMIDHIKQQLKKFL